MRAAVQESNALTGADTIILPPNTYLLTQLAELTITGDLTITGSGASTTIIDGNKSLRANSGVLTIDFATVNISGLTIRNGGRAQGGGIYKTGTLTLINSTVSGNAASHGGGIYNGSGTLTLTNSTVSGNSAAEDGGGIFNPFSGLMIVTNSTVTGNAASNNASLRAVLAEEGEPKSSHPIRETFFGCCASAMTTTASNTTATRIDGTAAFFIVHLVSSVIYPAERRDLSNEGLGQAEINVSAKLTRFVRWRERKLPI